MITYYGYCDGSGEFYVIVDSDRCCGCGKCIAVCPEKTLELKTEFIDLEDKTVVAVKEDHRKKIKYTCEACRPDKGDTPCILACEAKAIKCIHHANICIGRS